MSDPAKPGRQIELVAMVDRPQDRVQIIRNLRNSRGDVKTSANLGWIPLPKWRAFLSKSSVNAQEISPTLLEQLCAEDRG